MSEQAPTQAQFDTLEQARLDAEGINPERVRYHEWVGNPGDENISNAAADLAAYLESRPYDAYEGTKIAHHPKTGRVMDTDEHFDEKRERHYRKTLGTDYENMSVSELAKEMGKAEANDDKTKFTSLDDILSKKIEDFADAVKTERNPKGLPDESREAMHARVGKIREAERDRIRKAQKEIDASGVADKDTEKPANWNDILRGADAQKAFAEGGEEAYLAYIKAQIANGGEPNNETKAPKAIEAGPQPKELMPGEVQLEISEELASKLQQLDIERDEFAKMLAGRSGATFFSRKFSKDKVGQAQESYQNLRAELGGEIAKLMRNAGYSEENIAAFAGIASIGEAAKLTGAVYDQRVELADSKQLKWFYDKWASWGGKNKFFSKAGLKGNFKKAAVMAVPAMAVGVAGGAVFGSALAVVAGITIARGVGRNLAGAKMNKEANSKEVAHGQGKAMGAAMQGTIGAANKANRVATADEIAATARGEADRWKHRNDKRAVGAVAIGLVAAGAGAAIGSAIHDGLFSGGGKAAPKVTTQHIAPKFGPTTEAVPAPSHIDTSNYVYPWNWAEAKAGTNNGSNLLFGLADKAQASGHTVQWTNVVNGNYNNAQLWIDGRVDTDYVVNTLNQFS